MQWLCSSNEEQQSNGGEHQDIIEDSQSDLSTGPTMFSLGLQPDGGEEQQDNGGEHLPGNNGDEHSALSIASTTSTLALGNVPYQVPDFVLLYSHLEAPLPKNIGPNVTWNDILLALVELKKETSHSVGPDERKQQLELQLLKARAQLGKQVSTFLLPFLSVMSKI